jgi:hypothetical protein
LIRQARHQLSVMPCPAPIQADVGNQKARAPIGRAFQTDGPARREAAAAQSGLHTFTSWKRPGVQPKPAARPLLADAREAGS